MAHDLSSTPYEQVFKMCMRNGYEMLCMPRYASLAAMPSMSLMARHLALVRKDNNFTPWRAAEDSL